jgi:hypothetical protein
MKTANTSQTHAGPASTADELLAAEWRASAALQDEYPTPEAYVAIMRRRARQPAASAATPAETPTPDRWAAEWRASAALQDEYPTEAAYVATMKRKF